MSQIEVVMVSRLSEHQKACALIPEMTEKEWTDFLKSVEESGIRQPLDVNQNYEVLDGRHRLRAAIKLDIEKVDVRVHEFTEDEEIKFVRDTAIERRSLTPAQRMHIVLSTEELVNSIFEEGEQARVEGNKKGGLIKNNGGLASTEAKAQNPHSSSRKLAEIAGTSKSQIDRMRKIKNESPENYEQVVNGDKSIYKAYMELPTTIDTHNGKPSPNIDKVSEVKKPNEQPFDLPQEDVEKQIFNANVSTFISHTEQLIGFIERMDNVDEIMLEAKKRVDVKRYIEDFEGIIKTLKNGGTTNE